MFGKRIDLFKLFGFEIRIDLSWVVLAILVAWSLSAGLFPFRYEGLSTQTYWIMGTVVAIGLFLIFMEILQFFGGNYIGGMWWFFIGMFVRSAAKMSYSQVLVHKALEGEPVGRFMKKNPVTVPPSTTVEELAEGRA